MKNQKLNQGANKKKQLLNLKKIFQHLKTAVKSDKPEELIAYSIIDTIISSKTSDNEIVASTAVNNGDDSTNNANKKPKPGLHIDSK